jgi:rhodanese-related sulfurtransferase
MSHSQAFYEGLPSMNNRSLKSLILVAFLALSSNPLLADENIVEQMNEYMSFQPYESGIMVPQQIDMSVFETALFVDTRDAEQYAKETIPGAINIEWREVLERIDEIPETGKVILFCNTGSLSSQATFALRVAGRTNVVVLQTGIIGWKKDAAYKP